MFLEAKSLSFKETIMRPCDPNMQSFKFPLLSATFLLRPQNFCSLKKKQKDNKSSLPFFSFICKKKVKPNGDFCGNYVIVQCLLL